MKHLDPAYVAQLEQAAFNQFHTNQGFSFGPYILGYALDGVFFGLLIMQYWRWYWASYKTEKLAIRLLVYYTFLISVVYTCMISDFMFWLFAYGFGIYWRFYNFDKITTFFLLVSLTQTPVSFYFVYRAYKLWGNSKILGIIMSLLLILSFGICIALKIVAPYIIQVTGLDNVSDTQESYTVIFLIIWLGSAMLTDIMVTGSIAWALLRTRREFQGTEHTDRIIKRFLKMCMEAQLIPTVFTAGFLITFAAFPTSNLSAFFLCTPKVYVLALMIVLNARNKFQAYFGSGSGGHLPNGEPSYRARAAGGTRPTQTQTEIHVHTELFSEVYDMEPMPVKRSINRDPLPSPPAEQDASAKRPQVLETGLTQGRKRKSPEIPQDSSIVPLNMDYDDDSAFHVVLAQQGLLDIAGPSIMTSAREKQTEISGAGFSRRRSLVNET